MCSLWCHWILRFVILRQSKDGRLYVNGRHYAILFIIFSLKASIYKLGFGLDTAVAHAQLCWNGADLCLIALQALHVRSYTHPRPQSLV